MSPLLLSTRVLATMSASPHSVNLHRPFICDECSKVFTRSVSTVTYVPLPVLIRNPNRRTCNDISVLVSPEMHFHVLSSITISLIFSKVIMELNARIFNVLLARLNFLGGLVYPLPMTFVTTVLIIVQ
jgi:hypothetical protein